MFRKNIRSLCFNCKRLLIRRRSDFSVVSLGNGKQGSARGLFVTCGEKRLIFNCGEGFVRTAHEHKIRLPVTKIKHIFITYKNWSNLGGLNNLLLTLEESQTQSGGGKCIDLHGPPDIEYICNLNKAFIIAKSFKIVKHEYTEPSLQENDFSVTYVPLFSVSEQMRFNHQSQKIKGVQGSDVAVAYICKGAVTLCYFALDKCLEFGNDLIPFMRKLKDGDSVTLPNGTLVRPEDVLYPELPRPVSIVVECPNEDYLESLLAAEAFIPYQDETNEVADIIVHFTSAVMMRHKLYREWMLRFPKSTQHLIINENCSTKTLWQRQKFQEKLHCFHKEMFPCLQENRTKNGKKIPCQIENTIVLNPLHEYHLRPMDDIKPLQTIDCLDLNSSKDLETKEKYLEYYQPSYEFPEIIFLGTKSKLATPLANVSSILVALSENQSVLLDCGEGTYGQLMALFGEQGFSDFLYKFVAVFVSHIHLDHHIGLITLLLERKKLNNANNLPRLQVIAPKALIFWLISYHKLFEPILFNLRLIASSDIVFGKEETLLFSVADQLNLKEFGTVPVKHCKDSFGIIITNANGFKLVYSGDTMPCDELILAGKNCDLLIHEATFGDAFVETARIGRHSTVSEALGVAQKMKAKNSLLTHFSHRSDLKSLSDKCQDLHVGLAFDFMKVSPRTLPLIPSLSEAILKGLFCKKEESDDLPVDEEIEL